MISEYGNLTFLGDQTFDDDATEILRIQQVYYSDANLALKSGEGTLRIGNLIRTIYQIIQSAMVQGSVWVGCFLEMCSIFVNALNNCQVYG